MASRRHSTRRRRPVNRETEREQTGPKKHRVAIPSSTRKQAAKALDNLRTRLLDLTARNRLINFRHTKTGSLRIIDELPDQLVETLLADTEMRFIPVPEPKRDQLVQMNFVDIEGDTGREVALQKDPTAEEWAKRLGIATDYEVPRPSGEKRQGKHTDNAIQTLLFPYELEVRLKRLHQTSESAIQEMGANILFLAFGFLEWFDNDNDNARLAPLFLVPVRLQKGRLNPKTRTYEYGLRYSGEEIIANLSLREKLRLDFALELPDLDENTSPEAYFSALEDVIRRNQPRWRVRRFVSMTLLNFSKLLMYLDLNPENWPAHGNILDHPVVTQILSGYDPGKAEGQNSSGDLGFGEEYLIDDMEDIHSKYPLIDDADSSQHSALIDAIDGKNLVIEGPPGTGKSQTITNLIAAALSQGKRVLFVAEKLAALEVVRRRLDAVGLGEFCLELHSHKSQKRKVLDEVSHRLKKHGRYRKPRDLAVEIRRYEDLKEELSAHANRINRHWKKTDKTLHEIFMAATRYREAVSVDPETVYPKPCNGTSFDPATQRRAEDEVRAFRKISEAVTGQLNGNATLKDHPWHGVRHLELQAFDLPRIEVALEAWQGALRNLNGERSRLASHLQCPEESIPDSISGFLSLQLDLNAVPGLKGDELLDLLPALRGEALVETRRSIKLFHAIQSLYASLAQQVGPELLHDLSAVEEYRSGCEELSKHVAPTVKLGSLTDATTKMRAMEKRLLEVDAVLTEIGAVVGKAAAKHLEPSVVGLVEFGTLLELVAELDPPLWALRDDLFDNEELDEILPTLRAELEELHQLHELLVGLFNLDDLPSADKIRQLQGVLCAGGIFRWLKSGWRQARREVRALAVSDQNRLSQLTPKLDEAAEFVARRSGLDSNERYEKLLGDHMNGLETKISQLESLRGWYRKVRQKYGVGFGPKVALGGAVISLPAGIARGLRSLFDRGLSHQLIDLLQDLQKLRVVFAPVGKLRSDAQRIAGTGGVLAPLLASIDRAVGVCRPVITSGAMTVADLASRVAEFDSLKNAVNRWKRKDIDSRLFGGRLGLTPGPNTANTAPLARLQNTYSLALYLDRQCKNSAVQQYLYTQLDPAAFSALSMLAEGIGAALMAETVQREQVRRLVDLDADAWMSNSSDQIDAIIDRNQLALLSGDAFPRWLDYLRARHQMTSLGLGNLTERVELGEVPIHQIEDAHKAGAFDALAREIFRDQPKLVKFSGRSQEAVQDNFRRCDNRLKALQCEQIAWQIDRTKIPQGERGARVSEYTERYLVEKECSKKTRHIPIRQLLRKAGNALIALKPCFMMGPMSVAQYLAPGELEFDLVVMDEASQIKPQDALGAIARGSQLVIVGDPKQLPPTNFFERAVDDEEEDPTALEESESILDATLPMFPARRLRWHYRSQHESLIAFSNYSFYDGDLVIFPSPHRDADGYGIQFARVPRGCFVNRRNMEEARIISEAVREHLRHRNKETLGVVAMNSEQRLQIEVAIEALGREDAAFRRLLENDAGRLEPLFVKNLENVQGDERDVIFISMTYGPQETGGKVFQRFGPINSDTGWRRLNVLFTRSRRCMRIFSSMGSDDIVAGSAAKFGVRALRNFLSYCETGILHKTERDSGRAPDSDFEIAVMSALRNKGFECVPQVGVAGFFIDIAVVDPNKPGRFLMGIECDGATYHSAKSARDRDRLRQTILERLGWTIRRIWSTDWFKNPHAELQPIVQELITLSEKPSEEPVSEGRAIQAIISEVESRETVLERFLSKKIELKDQLVAFDEEIVRTDDPNVPDSHRLLRPAMLEAFLEYRPCSESEYLELIPAYLRRTTGTSELRFLGDVLEIINTAAGTTVQD